LDDIYKYCITEQVCPSDVINGRLSSNCLRVRGSICGFTCNDGFQRSSKTLVALTCRNDHTWDSDVRKLCAGEPTVCKLLTFCYRL